MEDLKLDDQKVLFFLFIAISILYFVPPMLFSTLDQLWGIIVYLFATERQITATQRFIYFTPPLVILFGFFMTLQREPSRIGILSFEVLALMMFAIQIGFIVLSFQTGKWHFEMLPKNLTFSELSH